MDPPRASPVPKKKAAGSAVSCKQGSRGPRCLVPQCAHRQLPLWSSPNPLLRGRLLVDAALLCMPKHSRGPPLPLLWPKSMSASLSCLDWAAALPRWIVRSRTTFGAYLAASFSLPPCCGTSAPASATFPLPFPDRVFSMAVAQSLLAEIGNAL